MSFSSGPMKICSHEVETQEMQTAWNLIITFSCSAFKICLLGQQFLDIENIMWLVGIFFVLRTKSYYVLRISLSYFFPSQENFPSCSDYYLIQNL